LPGFAGFTPSVIVSGAATHTPQHCQSLLDPPYARLGLLRALDRKHVLTLPAVGQPVVGGAGDWIGVEGADEIRRLDHNPRLGIDFHLDLDLIAGHDTGGLSVGVAEAEQVTARMIATLLFQECPLIVMVTAGRLPPPSASTTSGGTSKPLIGSGGST
jgi:hypothetical protein